MCFRRSLKVGYSLAVLLISSSLFSRAFDLTGNSAIIWQNDATRDVGIWFLRQTNFLSAAYVATAIPGDWRVGATGDFNRDGFSDLVWHSPSAQTVGIWLMKGTTQIGRSKLFNVQAGMQVAGAGDFNNDGYTDVVLRNPFWDLSLVYLMDGPDWKGQSLSLPKQPGPTWDFAVAGDFNKDGYADLFWREQKSGRNVVWIMQGNQISESVELRPETDLGFKLAGIGSFNLVGNTDILWRHTNGPTKLWLMRGTELMNQMSLPSVSDPNWRVAGVGGYTNVLFLTAQASLAPANLLLRWNYGSGRPLTIQRRTFGNQKWTTIAKDHVPYWYQDSQVQPGQRYEYMVGSDYILAGMAAAPIENRGTVILVVEQTLAKSIAPDLELLKSDLVGDGWTVVRTNVPPHNDFLWSSNQAAIASIKSFIQNIYRNNPDRTKAVYLLGHVPIPYSGFHNPDGHGSRALPADVYYGDIDGIYTDSKVHFGSFLTGPPLSRHDNFLNDGKFDQNRIATNASGIAELELAVGRVDLSGLLSFGSTEARLTQRYLAKTRAYRHQRFVLPDRIQVATFFPTGPNREAYGQARRIGSRLFGLDSKAVIEGDPFDTNNVALWGILGGYGLPFAIYGNNGWYRQSAELAQTRWEPRIAFASIFASYLFDFHYPDGFLRAFLGTPTHGLAVMWFRPLEEDRVGLSYEQTALGEPIGTGLLRSVNDAERDRSGNIYISLQGDPTLRLQVLAPPKIDGTITKMPITWLDPGDASITYLVYKSSNSLDGPWFRLTPEPISDFSFTDPDPISVPTLYQVRAVKLTTTGSGSFTNLSQAAFVEIKPPTPSDSNSQ